MEIERLHEMLTAAGIDHEWRDRTPDGWSEMCWRFPDIFESDRVWGWQIRVYEENGGCLISAIEGWGTYGYASKDDFGGPSDLIEIMGLLTPEEEENNSVVGWLTAEEVFRRIKEAVCSK